MDTSTQTLFTTHQPAALNKGAGRSTYAMSGQQTAPVALNKAQAITGAPEMSMGLPMARSARQAQPVMFVSQTSTAEFLPSNTKFSLNYDAPSRSANAPKMALPKQSQPSQVISTVNVSDMSSQAKMRFNRSQVSMSAAKDVSDEFTVSTTSGNMNMRANHMDEQMNPKLNMGQIAGATAVALALFSANPAFAADLGNGKQIFEGNCAACHAGGQNVIEAQKTLDKDALTEYLDGGFNEKAIITQVKNGKNSMPAWGGRLSEDEINNVSAYVFDQASGSKWGA